MAKPDITTPDALVAHLERMKRPTLKVAAADVDGILRGKYVFGEAALSIARSGFGICDGVFGWDCADSLYDKVAFTGWHTGYPDVKARLDHASTRFAPWEPEVPLVLGSYVDGAGAPLPICPRSLAARMVEAARAEGYTVRSGMEFEWTNFLNGSLELHEGGFKGLRPATGGMAGYSLERLAQHRGYVQALALDLPALGIELEALHTENGPGLFEAAIRHQAGLEAADQAALFKDSVKQIARRFGLTASFMAKWNPSLQGSSAHLHQSLWKDGANLFADPDGRHGMSRAFEHWVAGILHALPEVLPLYAPTVNSYKRFVEGYWAPTHPVWSLGHRCAALRVITGGAATRVEVRVPGADVNPYLSLAATIACGLYGLLHQLPLETGPVAGATTPREFPRLPATLAAATERFERSPLARQLFGHAFVDHFAATREWEWRQFRQAVTDWETTRYLETI